MDIANTSKLKENFNNLLYHKITQELLDKISSLTKENDLLEKENNFLQKELDNNEKLIRNLVLEYTPYMVSDVIYEIFNVRLSSCAIVNTASENNLFASKYMALRTPRKKGSDKKEASTVMFSTLGISYLLQFLIEKYAINLDARADDFETAVRQLEEGDFDEI